MDDGESADITRKPSIGRQDDLPRPVKERRPVIATRAPSGDAYPATAGTGPHDTPRDTSTRRPSIILTPQPGNLTLPPPPSPSPSQLPPAAQQISADAAVYYRAAPQQQPQQQLPSSLEGRAPSGPSAAAASTLPPLPPALWPPPATISATTPSTFSAAATAVPGPAATLAPAAMQSAFAGDPYSQLPPPPPPLLPPPQAPEAPGAAAAAAGIASPLRPPPGLDAVGPPPPVITAPPAPPASGLPPRQPQPPRHTHAPSVASSVFDESDGDSEEQDLARRSARMYPRIAPAATMAAAAAGGAAATSAGGAAAVARAPSSTVTSAAPSGGAPAVATAAAPVVAAVAGALGPGGDSGAGAGAGAAFSAAGLAGGSRVALFATPDAAAAAAAAAAATTDLSLLPVLQQMQMQLIQQQQVLQQHGLLGQPAVLPNLSVLPLHVQGPHQQQQLQPMTLGSQMGSLMTSSEAGAEAGAGAGVGVGVAQLGGAAAAPAAAVLPLSLYGSTSSSIVYGGSDAGAGMPLQPPLRQPPQQQPGPQGQSPGQAPAQQQQLLPLQGQQQLLLLQQHQNQKALQEQYLRQWSEVRPGTAGAASGGGGAAAAAAATAASTSTTVGPALPLGGAVTAVGTAVGTAAQSATGTRVPAPVPVSNQYGVGVAVGGTATPSLTSASPPKVEPGPGGSGESTGAASGPFAAPPPQPLQPAAVAPVVAAAAAAAAASAAEAMALAAAPLAMADAQFAHSLEEGGMPAAAAAEAGGSAGASLRGQPPDEAAAAAAAGAAAAAAPAIAVANGGGAVGGGGGGAGAADPDKSRGPPGPAAPSAEAVAENLAGNIDAIAIFEPDDEEDDEDADEDDEPSRRWYQRPAVLWFLCSVGLGLALLVVGVILHTHLRDVQDAYRWCYFFAAMPLLYYALSYASLHAFNLIEWWFFRESLLYLQNVQRNALWLLFFLVLLPWYYTVFRWAWCTSTAALPNRCQSAAYIQATQIVWNILLCLMLFCLANLLKAVLAKLLTTHFYRTAHFKKLKNALEKEYALQVLSRPRRTVLAERTAVQQLAVDGAHQRTWHHLTSFLHHHHHHHQHAEGAAVGANAAAGGAASPGAETAAAAATTTATTTPSVTVMTYGGDGVHNGGGNAVPSSTAFGAQRAVPPIAEEGEEAEGVTRPGGARAVASSPYDLPVTPAATAVLNVSAPAAAWALAPAAPGAMPAPPAAAVTSAGAAAATAPSAAAPLSPAVLPPGSPSPTQLPRPSGAESQHHQIHLQQLQPQPQVLLQQQPLNLNPPQAGQVAPLAPVSPFLAPLDRPQPQPSAPGSGQPSSGPLLGPSMGAGGASTAATRTAARGGGGGGGGGGADGWGALLPGLLAPRRDSHDSRASKASAAVKPPVRAATGTLGDTAAARARKGAEALTAAMVEAAAPAGGAVLAVQKKGLRGLTDSELEKVRTAIVIKTQSALISKYTDRSDEAMAKELGRVKRFATALFFNVLPPDSGRDYLILPDLLVFFEAAEGAGGGAGGAGGGFAADGPVSRKPTGMPKTASLARQQEPGPVAAAAAAAGGKAGGAGGAAAVAGGEGLKSIGRVSLAAATDPARIRRQQARQRAAEEAARKAFAFFDADSDGQVIRSEVREAVVNIYKERRNMARSLKDTETIVQSLEFGIGVVIHFVFAAVYLLIWGVDLLTGFSTFSATVLALTFVFGNSVKNMYESMLFLFVTHPYDVGDCILIGTEMYRVKKISLLYTDMVKSSGERMYMPNTALISQGIINWTRSKTKSESARLVCDIGVAWEVREDIQAALRCYAREHPTEFDGEPSCNFRELADPLKVVLVCSWTYNFAPDEFSRLGPARNGMLFIVQSKAREHRLHHTTYTDSPT